ncbi:hypothetical protein J1614_001585 [Plenodomus biglobosus]|nr:hypothetical protein J1614_001585 [Plenodomus biglobosus]
MMAANAGRQHEETAGCNKDSRCVASKADDGGKSVAGIDMGNGNAVSKWELDEDAVCVLVVPPSDVPGDAFRLVQILVVVCMWRVPLCAKPSQLKPAKGSLICSTSGLRLDASSWSEELFLPNLHHEALGGSKTRYFPHCSHELVSPHGLSIRTSDTMEVLVPISFPIRQRKMLPLLDIIPSARGHMDGVVAASLCNALSALADRTTALALWLGQDLWTSN